MAYILKPFRTAHPSIVIATFVDDIIFAKKVQAVDEPLPTLLAEFIALFAKHGLRFDLSDTAKSSVFSIQPLSPSLQQALQGIGMRCQNEGIAPCKIACGTDNFMSNDATKKIAKLKGRYVAFNALWPILLNYDRSLKKPSYRVYEPYLNLVRLSFLSMSTYVLRTLHPSKCAAYRSASVAQRQ